MYPLLTWLAGMRKKEPAGSITITVRFNGNDFTEEEMERIKTFAKMLKKKGDANGENQ